MKNMVRMLAYQKGNKNNLKTKKMVLKKGSNGPEVEELQRLLGIRVDGDFGPATELAVMKIQGQIGLKTDGVVGPKTWEKLKSKN